MAGMGEHKFFLDEAFLGGPLGELAQWCDLISALYILGHDLIIAFQVEDVPRWEKVFPHQQWLIAKFFSTFIRSSTEMFLRIKTLIISRVYLKIPHWWRSPSETTSFTWSYCVLSWIEICVAVPIGSHFCAKIRQLATTNLRTQSEPLWSSFNLYNDIFPVEFQKFLRQVACPSSV